MKDTQTIKTTTELRQLSIKAPLLDGFDQILSPEAQQFLLELHLKFNERRKELLQLRKQRQQAIENGQLPTFLESTQSIRDSDWKVAPLPPDLLDRRVEITGPVDRKMIINALNSGAKVFMADLEDSNSPSWTNVIQGQINLRDAVNRSIHFTHPRTQKEYQLKEEGLATLMVRPRGWHLEEKQLEVDGEAMSGSLVDFGLYFFHNVQQLLANGTGPYFCLLYTSPSPRDGLLSRMPSSA